MPPSIQGYVRFTIYDSGGTLTLAPTPWQEAAVLPAQDGHAIIGAEIPRGACSQPQPNRQRLAEWSFRNVEFSTPDTLFAGISSLPPGHVMQISAGQIHPARRYFAPEERVSTEQYARLSGCLPRP